MAKGTCKIEDCGRPAWARGWCQAHYKRWSLHGDPLHGGPIRPQIGGPCSVDGCDQPRNAKGYCAKHYQRWKRTGDPLGPTGKWTRRLERLPNGHDLSEEELRLRHRSRILVAKYGITHEEFMAMAEAQGGRCALCGCEPANKGRGDRWLHVDHCHATGKVRGLLCFDCNKSLGRIERLGLEHVVAYLAG